MRLFRRFVFECVLFFSILAELIHLNVFRVRCGVDCTVEVLHEIALLSICAESNNIVHLKDVFQNKHEVVLVLE